MNYQQTLDYLYQQLPMFQRIGSAAYKKDLTNTLALCQYLNNPQSQLTTIHIGGTNGKGTLTHALGAVFQATGKKVGLYTSPHYKDFRERIKINGQYISEQAVVDFVQKIKPESERIQPSFFELTVAMAFDYFVQQQVDIAIIEVGLGGRLDSTNVITPILSVITNISYDHTDMLGDTLALIAAEKAGIIKPNVPVVIGETLPETQTVFVQKATEQNAPIVFADQQMQVTNVVQQLNSMCVDVLDYKGNVLFKQLKTDLTGNYQQKNIITLLQAIQVLNNMGFNLGADVVSKALQQVRPLTNFMGRWQVLNTQNPLVIADSAHNEAGITEAMWQLQQLPKTHLHLVMGFVKDKDLGKILPLLPTTATYYFCKANIPRGLPATDLQQMAYQYGLQGNAYNSVADAYQAALKEAATTDLVYIGGSIFVLAEIL